MAKKIENTQKTLFKNANVLNVFTEEFEKTNILIKGEKIIGVGQYTESEANETVDLSGKFIVPGFIDGHMHIESTMLLPAELARVTLPHGTTSVVADPHEIANVCGKDGINFMIQSSKNLPLNVYIMLPSCVPATKFDESGAVLKAKDLRSFYKNKRVLGLAEMMNFPGVLVDDKDTLQKIDEAINQNKIVDGHAPLLSGKNLDKYISSGINSDHECSSATEAMERIKKGQWVMIREGTAAKNLNALLPLFEKPYADRCLLVTDDRHPADLIKEGQIDNIIRKAIQNGKSPITAIKMGTIQAAECFGLKWIGAIAPGYKADFLVLNDLNSIDIKDVYSNGKKVVSDKITLDFENPKVSKNLLKKVYNTVHLKSLCEKDFFIPEQQGECRVIQVVKGELITNEIHEKLDFSVNNGISVERDILKICVIERHNKTGHIAKGLINGIGLKKGAIASTVSHDSHNLIIIGTNDKDIAFAANKIKELGGGNIFVSEQKVVTSMPLPIAGLMTDLKAEQIAELNQKIRKEVSKNSSNNEIEPFMNMAFVSLAVIPNLKITSKGLVDVNEQKLVELFLS